MNNCYFAVYMLFFMYKCFLCVQNNTRPVLDRFQDSSKTGSRICFKKCFFLMISHVCCVYGNELFWHIFCQLFAVFFCCPFCLLCMCFFECAVQMTCFLSMQYKSLFECFLSLQYKSLLCFLGGRGV